MKVSEKQSSLTEFSVVCPNTKQSKSNCGVTYITTLFVNDYMLHVDQPSIKPCFTVA